MNTTLRRRKKQQERGIPSVAWNPITNLPGLNFLLDYQSTRFTDAARTIIPTNNNDLIYNWDDRKNSRNLRAFAEDTTRPLLADGPTGKAIKWDGIAAKSLYFATGSQICPVTPSITLIIVFQKQVDNQLSSIMGRGSFGTTGGIGMTTNAAFSVNFHCTATQTDQLTAGRVIATNTWTVMAMSYDGTTFRALIDGDVVQSVAKAGSIVYAGAATAFWIGSRTNDGTTDSGKNAKQIAFAAVTSDTFDDAGLTALVANVKTYVGL